MCVHICMCIHNFGAGTALRSVPANHVVLVRLTLDQFIFWPKLPQIAGFGIKNLQKKFSGVTPRPPQQERAIPSRTHLQHDYTSCAGYDTIRYEMLF